MTLEPDRATRTAPHGDALLRARERWVKVAEGELEPYGLFPVLDPALEAAGATVELVPLWPELARACEQAEARWTQLLDGQSERVRFALEVRMDLDVCTYLGLDTPSRIRANLEAAQEVAHVWGLPVVLDPTLEPGQWRLEVEPRSQR